MTDKETEPRIKVKEIEEIETNFAGKFEDIISQLQVWMNKGWEGIEYISEPYEEGAYYFYKHREENDQEYNKRMKELEKQKTQELKEKEKRRKEYEKLKKEFG